MRKQVKTLFDDESAVSPVIGVILMVAITVILAAVIGTMVMDMTKEVGDTAPTSSIQAADGADTYALDDGADQTAFRLSHQNGDGIVIDQMKVLIKDGNGAIVASYSAGSWTVANGASLTLFYNGADMTTAGAYSSGEEFSVGDSITVEQLEGGTTADASVIPAASGTEYQIQIVHSKTDSVVLDTDVALN